MAISRFSTSRLTQGLPKYQNAWDQDGVQQGAMVPIASIIVNAQTPDITFSNIPQIYQDLMIVVQARRTDASVENNLLITPYYTGIAGSSNGSTLLSTDGASMTSYRYSTQDAGYAGSVPAASANVGIWGISIWQLMNYASTTQWKTAIFKTSYDNNGSGRFVLGSNTTRATGAITTVNVSTFNSSIYFIPGSTATLYGIKAGA